MATPVTNFAKGTVSTGYDASATSVVLTTGHGSRFPSTSPFPVTWWNATDYSDPSDDPNRELVTVTNRAGDTLTVTRGVEGTSASTKNTGGKTYKMVEGWTKAMYDALFTLSLSQTFRGLTVQTHPDSDKALAQVQFSADSITMDDGTEIQDWSKIDVNLAASGLNGLDTGSEAANVGYELWAIYNGTTKAGLLHRAKDYLLDETWDQSGGTTEDGQHLLRDATGRTKLAQGFKVDTAGPCEFVDVKIGKVGTPTGNFWLTIEATSGGVPSNTPLATSDKYDVARLTTAAVFIRVPFRTPSSLSAATQYHLVLQGDFSVSGVNHMFWRADTTASTYANGSKAAYDGATWTSDTDDDFLFKIYITQNDVAVTLPGTYTRKALICPSVMNNGSSNLKNFFAKDKEVFCGYHGDWKIGTTAGEPTLVPLVGFIPPRSVVMAMLIHDASASNNVAGGLTVTDLIGTPTVELVGSVRCVNQAGQQAAFPLLALGPYQGFMELSDAGTGNLYVTSFSW